MKRAYISGGITGVKDYKQNFQTAENYLLKQGYTVVNPVHLGYQLKYELYMRQDLKELLCCTHIYMMSGWWKSKGAVVELIVAKICGLVVVYESAPGTTIGILDILRGIING